MITLHDVRMRTATEVARKQPTNPGLNSEQMIKSVLDSMINDILLVQEAKRFKITAEDSDVEGEIKKMMMRSRMSQQAFEANLVRQGTNITKLREHVRNNIVRQRMLSVMVGRKIMLPEGEVEKYYQANKGKFTTQKAASFSIIIFPQNVNAQEIYEQIKSGKTSFDAAAKKYSIDNTGKSGGKVSNVPWASLPPPMQQMFSRITPGQMSPLVKSEKNFALIRLDNLVDGSKTLSLEEARPQIESILREPLFGERYNEYMQQLRSKAVIDYRL